MNSGHNTRSAAGLPQEGYQALLRHYTLWLEAERHPSRYTLRNYRTDITHFLAYLQEEECELQHADRNLLRRYLAQQLAAGVAPASIRRKVSSLRSFYRFLSQQGYVATDPTHGVRGPSMPRRLPSFLPLDDTLQVIAAADEDSPISLRDRAILELLYASGMRVSELGGLDLGDVDLGQRQLRVRGKGHRERLVLMGLPAAQALSHYLANGRPCLLRDPGEVALFLNRFGGRLSVRAVQLLVRRYSRRAGLAQRTYPHLLRHTFATHLVDGGADIRVVQGLLGHARVATTQVYTHVTQSHLREVYEAAFRDRMGPRHQPQEEPDDAHSAD